MNFNRRAARRLSLVAAVLAVGSSVAACGSSAGGHKAGGGFEMWGITDPALTSAINQYNKDNPSAKISSDMVPGGNQLDTKVQPAIAAKRLPDIIEVDKPTELASLAKQGMIVNLTSALQKSGFVNRFSKGIQRLMQVDGAYYSVPVSQMNTMTFFYNKSIFQKAGVSVPATWSQLVGDVPALKKASSGSCAIAYDGGDTFAAENYQQQLLGYVGGLDAVQKVATGKHDVWQSAELSQADKLLQQLVDTKPFEYGAGAIKQSSGTPYQLVGSGKCAIYLTGDFGYGGFQKYSPSIVKSNQLGWFPFPVVQESQVNQPPIVDAGSFNVLAISAKSKHRAQALDFLQKYLFTPSYNSTALKNSYVPVVSGIGSEVAKSSPYNKYIYDLEQKASGFSVNLKDLLPTAISNEYQTAATALAMGQSSPQKFASDMVSASKNAGL